VNTYSGAKVLGIIKKVEGIVGTTDIQLPISRSCPYLSLKKSSSPGDRRHRSPFSPGDRHHRSVASHLFAGSPWPSSREVRRSGTASIAWQRAGGARRGEHALVGAGPYLSEPAPPKLSRDDADHRAASPTRYETTTAACPSTPKCRHPHRSSDFPFQIVTSQP
jgi:hypothetical protein